MPRSSRMIAFARRAMLNPTAPRHGHQVPSLVVAQEAGSYHGRNEPWSAGTGNPFSPSDSVRVYPARKGADFRWVSAESRNLDASTGGDVRRRKLNRPMGKGNESSPCQANPGSDVPCRSGDNPLWWRLEPDDGQLSRPVLRGLGFGN